MREIRWHARGGQGAKTAAQLLAVAALGSGRSAQAFPEFGPERSGAPMQAYNRLDRGPIRRRYAITHPDAVVVLDPSLLEEVGVSEGLAPDGLLLLNADLPAWEVSARLGFEGRVICVPGPALAARAGTRFANVVMVGALAAALGEPPLEALEQAARELLGEKLSAEALEGTVAAIDAGYRYMEAACPA